MKRPPKPDRAERVWARIRRRKNGCWTWAGKPGSGGYCRFEGTLAHRASYEVFIGPIPEGLHIDHICRNRACVNPSHLQAVTQAENNRLGWERAWADGRPQRQLYELDLMVRSDFYQSESLRQYVIREAV